MTCKSSARGLDLPALAWEVVSVLDGLEVTELMGDEGLDEWADALFPDTQPGTE